jgi:hypothetical protein
MAGSGGTNAVALVWDAADAGGPSGAGNCYCLATGGDEARYDTVDYHRPTCGNADQKLLWESSSCSLMAPATGASILILFLDGRQFRYSNETYRDG